MKDTTAYIKDLELQIDYLIGYSPSGNHWKQEYYIRKQLLDEVLENKDTPDEIRNKINRIQESIYELQNKKEHKQPYFHKKMERQPVKVYYHGELVEEFLII